MKEGWKYVKLGEVASFTRGLTYSKNDETEISNKIVLRSNNVELSSGKLNFDELKYLKSEFEIPEDKFVKKGCLLMCMSNGSKIHLGKVALIDKDYGYAFGGFMALVSPKKELNPTFFYYSLSSPKYKNFIKQLSAGANINNIKVKELEQFSIPLPPLAEQEAIVERLDSSFAKIDAVKANAEKSLDEAKALFQSALTEMMKPKEGWEEKKLGEICDFVRGPFGGSLKKECFKNCGYAIYEQQNAIYNKFTFRYFINEEKYQSLIRFKVNSGDLIISCSGTIGKVAIVPENHKEGIINQALLKLTPRKVIKAFFLKYLMESNYFSKIINANTEGVAIKNIASVAVLKKLPIPLPPLSEQESIVSRLDAMSEKVRALEANYRKTITECDAMKQAMLREIFN